MSSLGNTNHVQTEKQAKAIAKDQKAFKGKTGLALIAAVNSAQDGKFAEQVIAATDLFSNYGISFMDTEIGKAFLAAGVPAHAVDKLVLAFGMNVLREVGKIHNETFNVSALLFSNKGKIARYTDNLQGLKTRRKLVLAYEPAVYTPVEGKLMLAGVKFGVTLRTPVKVAYRHAELNLQGKILALVKGL